MTIKCDKIIIQYDYDYILTSVLIVEFLSYIAIYLYHSKFYIK